MHRSSASATRSWPLTAAWTGSRPGPAAVTVGVGAREVLAAGGEGEVLAWFRAAVYVRMPGGVLVLVAPGVFPGPLYLRLERELPRLRPGDPAEADPDRVAVGRWDISVGGRTWRGPVPSPEDVLASVPRISDAARSVAGGSLVDPAARAEAETAVEAGDLEAAALALEGRGPGLTPSGDDVMAGVLFAARLLRGLPVEERTRAVAEGLRTGPIARAFAVWAARGQALSPAHRLVTAAVRGDATGARRAARTLAAVGESSGADFCVGLAMGMDLLADARP